MYELFSLISLYMRFCCKFLVKNKYERYYGPGRRPLAYLLYYMPTVSSAYAYIFIITLHRAPCCSRPLRRTLRYTHCDGRSVVNVRTHVYAKFRCAAY